MYTDIVYDTVPVNNSNQYKEIKSLKVGKEVYLPYIAGYRYVYNNPGVGQSIYFMLSFISNSSWSRAFAGEFEKDYTEVGLVRTSNTTILPLPLLVKTGRIYCYQSPTAGSSNLSIWYFIQYFRGKISEMLEGVDFD